MAPNVTTTPTIPSAWSPAVNNHSEIYLVNTTLYGTTLVLHPYTGVDELAGKTLPVLLDTDEPERYPRGSILLLEDTQVDLDVTFAFNTLAKIGVEHLMIVFRPTPEWVNDYVKSRKRPFSTKTQKGSWYFQVLMDAIVKAYVTHPHGHAPSVTVIDTVSANVTITNQSITLVPAHQLPGLLGQGYSKIMTL